jgi:triacylglycerol esterase/lipase EstA (alpha/beta hydrolase family)
MPSLSGEKYAGHNKPRKRITYQIKKKNKDQKKFFILSNVSANHTEKQDL